MHLQLSGIRKQFDKTIAVDDVSLALEQGEIVCLLGPSGCGKTTMLRLVAGLEQLDSGQIVLDGKDLAHVPTYQRGIGMMFQSYALFPHLTVAENVGYGLRMANAPTAQIAQRVQKMLTLVDLDGLEKRRIDQLSGGQQQRVALARSLATQPSILLLDEPLGSLDRLLRERLLGELRAILKEVGVTALYVTHDQSEAFGIADRVAVMNEGRIEQTAVPQELYARPTSAFVAEFLGHSNVVEMAGDGALQTQLRSTLGDTKALHVLIPPFAAELDGNDDLAIEATVLDYAFRGRFALLRCDVDGQTLLFSVDPFRGGFRPKPQNQITLQLNSATFVPLG